MAPIDQEKDPDADDNQARRDPDLALPSESAVIAANGSRMPAMARK